MIFLTLPLTPPKETEMNDDVMTSLANARHNHELGESCRACLHSSILDAQRQAGQEAETLATARRVSNMYHLRAKELAAVLLDARGLVRGLDVTLDARMDAALHDAGFLPTPTQGDPDE